MKLVDMQRMIQGERAFEQTPSQEKYHGYRAATYSQELFREEGSISVSCSNGTVPLQQPLVVQSTVPLHV